MFDSQLILSLPTLYSPSITLTLTNIPHVSKQTSQCVAFSIFILTKQGYPIFVVLTTLTYIRTLVSFPIFWFETIGEFFTKFFLKKVILEQKTHIYPKFVLFPKNGKKLLEKITNWNTWCHSWCFLLQYNLIWWFSIVVVPFYI
jgi:hypothetical protein